MTFDPLSEVLSVLVPRSYITAGFDAGGSWALTLDDLAGRIKCYVVMKGRCWLWVAGIDRALQLGEGDCFVLASGRTAVIASDLDTEPRLASEVLDPNRSGEVVVHNGGGDVFLVGSRFDLAGPHAGMMLQALPPLIRIDTVRESATMKLFIDMMMDELREARPGSSQIAQNLSHMMLAQALRLYLSSSAQTEIGWIAALADPRLNAAIAAMHSQPSHAWTLDDLAARAAMSRSSFARHFRSRVGETPLAHLTRWRMILACQKLATGHETVGQIALASGYTSEYSFNTAFRRIIGQSPGRYRHTEKQAATSAYSA
ncbi:AraC family transcriptional regulator [Agrobacterium sp. a22-2]|uniref:AraC family transcriptional regulator n=1 Tax=Agrobacterium sp. a22-2 TaxID=2283840 RepID=UPI00144695AA|nr:AraC family transcriptional regulator [Agrobacterium sp. a22-2]NKN37304.1 AraC family transcriptional regulator [Agrobacterium sp. a22-2]